MNITPEMVEETLNWSRESFGADPANLRLRWRDEDSEPVPGQGKTIVAHDSIPDWAYVLTAIKSEVKK